MTEGRVQSADTPAFVDPRGEHIYTRLADGTKVNVKLNGRDNPNCPRCQHYNALLYDREEIKQPEKGDDLITGHWRVCRDCSLPVLFSSFEVRGVIKEPEGLPVVLPEHNVEIGRKLERLFKEEAARMGLRVSQVASMAQFIVNDDLIDNLVAIEEDEAMPASKIPVEDGECVCLLNGKHFASEHGTAPEWDEKYFWYRKEN